MLKQLAKDTVIYGLGDFLFRLVAFAILPIYTHLFSLAEFGTLALIIATAGLLEIFISLGIHNSIQRFYWDPLVKESDRPILVSTGFFILLIWAIAVTTLLLIAIFPLREYIETKFHVIFLLFVLAFTASVMSQLVQYSLNVLRLHFSPWKFMVLSAIKNLSGILLGLLLVVGFKYGIAGYFTGNLLGFLIAIPLGLWMIRKELLWRFDYKMAIETIGFGYPFIFAGMAYWIFSSSDRWMLAWLSDPVELGLFSIAFIFATIITFFNSAFGQAWSPFVIKLYASDPIHHVTIGKIGSHFFFFLAMAGIMLSLFGKEILMLFTPISYWPAATIFTILVVGMVIAGTQQITALGISIQKKTHIFSVGAWGTAILNIGLNVILIPQYGAVGAAISTLLSYVVLTSFYFYWSQHLYPILYETKKIFFLIFMILIATGISFYLNTLNWAPIMVVFKILSISIILWLSNVVGILKLSELLKLLSFKNKQHDII